MKISIYSGELSLEIVYLLQSDCCIQSELSGYTLAFRLGRNTWHLGFETQGSRLQSCCRSNQWSRSSVWAQPSTLRHLWCTTRRDHCQPPLPSPPHAPWTWQCLVQEGTGEPTCWNPWNHWDRNRLYILLWSVVGKKKLTNHWWHGHTVNLDGDLEVVRLCPCFVRSNIQDTCRLPHWFSSLRCEGQRLDLNGNVEQQLSGKEAKGIVAEMQRCMEREIML